MLCCMEKYLNFPPIFIASAGRYHTCLPSWRKESSSRVYERYVSSDFLWAQKSASLYNNKTNDLILDLTPENVTQHSRIE